ncbi:MULTISPECIES: transcriptional regulator [Bacillus cereus group]|nr:transcriptional regulator [Bacillus thuringiensis]KAB2399794.1 transcriptional regulator [Bacillus cereus]
MKKWNDKTKVTCSIAGCSFRVLCIKKGEFPFYITVWK